MKQENDKLTEKCTSLEKALNNKEQEIQNLTADFDKKMSAFSTEASMLNEQITNMNDINEEAKRRMEILEEEKLKCLRDIVELSSRHEEERRKVEEELEKVRDELEIAGAALDCKTEENNTLQAKFDSAQHDLKQTTNALKDVRSEIETISAAKSVLEVSLEELRSSHAEEQEKISEQLETVREELRKANIALDSQTKDQNALQAKFDSAQLELEQTVNTLKDIRSEIEVISSAKSMLKESLQKSEKRANELEMVNEKKISSYIMKSYCLFLSADYCFEC